MKQRKYTLAWLVVVALAGVVPPAAGGQAENALGRFEHQRIAWHDCRTGPGDETGEQLAAVGALCGEVTVPLDYAAPSGRTLTVAVARRAASDPARRRGTLMVNTGGPGPSRDGVSLVAQGARDVAAGYDLVGIDPRFFGLSSPLECGWPTDLYLRGAQVASPDRAAFDVSTGVAKDLADRCGNRLDVLPHASTRNIARDMDVVRAAIGERKLSYLGWSYGSYLGAVHLQMFGDRVDRIVLDSPADPAVAGPGLTRETAQADAAALRDWATWVARRDRQYHLGGTAEQVLAEVDRIARTAAREPLRIGRHRAGLPMIPGLLLTVDDTDESYAEFSAQVRVMRDAALGLPVTPTPSQEQKLALYANPDVIPAFGFSATVANQCADRAASRDPRSYFRDIQAHRATEPLYGPLARDITPCAFWPVQPVEPPTRINTGAPALIVGASGDPVTPHNGQRAMHAALSGSRMVTLTDAFRHGVYLFDTAGCVTNAVESYLLGGVLPRTDVTCSRG